MSRYNTEQKKILIDFLEQHHDSSYTVEEIIEGIDNSGVNISLGKSTVYRIMTELVEARRVQRFADKKGRSFLYRIIADDLCRSHLHMKCMRCGRIFHLDRATSDALLERVKTINDFVISEEDTLLFGNCSACKAEDKND